MSNIEDLTVFLTADYSQVELRMLAQMSGDPLYIKQFNNDEDIHSQVGHQLTGWDIETLTNDKKERRKIKEFHFSIVYGTSKPSLYRNMRGKGIDITEEETSGMHDAYFEKYSGVKKFMDAMRKQAEDLGYVETLFGFRRYIYQSGDKGSYWGNQAINTPIQGSAHQLLIIALALTDQKKITYKILRKPIAEIHDELVFGVRLRNLPEGFKILKKLMEKDVVEYSRRYFGIKFRVPLVADFDAGFLMGTKIKYKGEPVEEFLKKWKEKYRKTSSIPYTDLLPKVG